MSQATTYAPFCLHCEMALELFTRTQHELLTTKVLTNYPKGRRNNEIKIKLGKKSSCEDQGHKKMKKQERKTYKRQEITKLCCSTGTGVQVLHTELS